MEKIISKFVDELLIHELIEESKRSNYLYGAEVMMLRLIGIIVILVIGLLTHNIIETIVFYTVFASLRVYTNGYHAKSRVACIIESAVCYILLCTVIQSIYIQYQEIGYVVTLTSMLIIILLSPINTNSMMLTKNEIEVHKKRIKWILLIYVIILVMNFNFNIAENVFIFFEMAIMLDAVLVLIGYYQLKWDENK